MSKLQSNTSVLLIIIFFIVILVTSKYMHEHVNNIVMIYMCNSYMGLYSVCWFSASCRKLLDVWLWWRISVTDKKNKISENGKIDKSIHNTFTWWSRKYLKSLPNNYNTIWLKYKNKNVINSSTNLCTNYLISTLIFT